MGQNGGASFVHGSLCHLGRFRFGDPVGFGDSCLQWESVDPHARFWYSTCNFRVAMKICSDTRQSEV